MSPRFSVVIPTYKRLDLLDLCLAKCSPDSQSIEEDYEVIVSDDDQAASASLALKEKFPWARWVQGPGKGPAANRNAGAAVAKGEWLVFTDDDCLPEPGWLQAYANTLKANENIKVLEGKTKPLGKRTALDQAAPVNLTGGFFWTCNLAIERKAFSSLRGFDEAYRYACMEDVDLASRILEARMAQVFVAQAIVYHPWRKVKKAWDDGRGSEIYYPALSYYLDKFPKEKYKHGSKRYLRSLFRELIKDTLPGVFRYRGRGLSYALAHHGYQLKIAMRRYGK